MGMYSTWEWQIMVSSIVPRCFKPFLRFLKFFDFCTPGRWGQTSLILRGIFAKNAEKLKNSQILWKWSKNGNITLQVSDVMDHYSASTWTILVSSMVLMCFKHVLWFLKFSEFCTPGCYSRISLVLLAIFVKFAAKIKNSQNLWKLPKNGKIRLQDTDVMWLYSIATWTKMVSSVILRCFNAFLRFLRISDCCTPGCYSRISLVLLAIFVKNGTKIKNSQNLWKLQKNGKIRLQVSDVMWLYSIATQTKMVSSVFLRCFNAFLRFLKISDCCTPEHCNWTSTIPWWIFVGNAAKIGNSQFFWKSLKNEKNML